MHTAQRNREIFLSYARADGRTVASNLHQRLEAIGHTVWQDVLDMQGGEGWWLQIEDRIAQAEAVVLVVTPAALASQIVRREWVAARRFGTHVLPVTNEPGIFRTAPRWMQQVDIFNLTPEHPDYGETWTRFTNQLEQLTPRRPVPFMEGLPLLSHFTRREREHRSLVDKFLDETRANPCFSTVVLHGPPGFGKTTLVQDVCYDPEIIEVFTGGILWVTLGEDGQGMRPGLNAMVSTLSGAQITFNTVEEAAARLNQLLEHRDCLMVLDDVWDSAHIKPYLGSQHCARLITSRDPENCRLEGGILEFIAEMRADEATQMLLNFLPSDTLQDDGVEDVRKALGTLAERLGEWPLLLNIFGGALRSEITVRKQSFKNALNWLQQGLDAVGLTAFDRSSVQDRNEALAKSMAISLRPYTVAQKQRLYELSIFRPDDAILQDVALRLWGAADEMSRFEAERLVREFSGTFFQLSFERQLDSLVLRFHDALREYLADQLPSDRKRALHRLFLASYNRDGKPWPSIEDDHYLYDHLAYHLHASGAPADLHALFQDPTWLNLRFKHRGYTYDGYLYDLAWAVDAAATSTLVQIKAEEPPQAIALSARYRLIRATIGSISGRYIPELVIRAVELGVWTPDRSISVAMRIPEVAQRVDMYRMLLASPSLVEPHRSQVEKLALVAVEEWQNPPAYPLVALSEHLTKPARDVILRRALDAAIEYPAAREKESRAQAALGIFDYYSAAKERAHALATVAKHLTDNLRDDVTQQGLKFISEVSDPKEKVYALAAWLNQLEGSQKREKLQEALATAHNIGNQQERIFALAAIATGLEDGEKADVLELAWSLTEDIGDDPWRAFCLSRVAPQLKGAKRRQSLELGLRTLETDRGWELIFACAPTFDPSEWAEVLAAIQKIADHKRRVGMLGELGAPMSHHDIEFAFKQALEMDTRYGTRSRDQQLAKLSPQLTADLLLHALELALAESPEESYLLDELTKRFSGKGDIEASSDEAEDSWEQDWRRGMRPLWQHGSAHSLTWVPDTAASDLAEHLPEDREAALQTELERVTHITDDVPIWTAQKKALALEHLIPQLSFHQLEEAWSQTRQISDGWYRSQPLLALACRLKGERREQALREAIEAVFEPGPANGDRRAAVIEQMVPLLPVSLLARAVDGALAFDEKYRIRALKALFPDIKGELIGPALEAIRDLSNDLSKRELLELLAENLTEDWIVVAVKVAEGIADEELRTAALEAIAPKASGASQELVFKAQKKLSSAAHRARVLVKLLPSEPGPQQLQRIRYEILDYLDHGTIPSRLEVLHFLTLNSLFTEPILDRETLISIANASLQICRVWRWGE